MIEEVRIAEPHDLEACIRLRMAWLERFREAHSSEERWCPAGVPVPWVEDEGTIREHLTEGESGCWAAVLTKLGQVEAYVLGRSDKVRGELLIQPHNPRVSVGVRPEEAGSRLLDFAIRHAAEEALERVRVSLHGFRDEVDPLVGLYRRHGFEGPPRLEMLSHRLLLDVGSYHLQFRSGEEIGLDGFYEIDATIRGCSVEESKRNLGISRRMWSVDPGTDWLAAYDGGSLVGVVEVAVTRGGVGVVDHLGIVKEYRGRGLGLRLLAGGLSALAGRTKTVWLDVDQDNLPALRLYDRAGFKLHHLHCEMTARVVSP